MKVNMKIGAVAVIMAVFSSVFVAGCSQSTDSDKKKNETEKPDNTETDTDKDNEPVKDYFEVTLGREQAWDGTFDRETSIITLPCDYRNISFSFSDNKNIDASDFNYVELSYSDLSNPTVSFSVVYADESYSTVYLQPHLNKIYLKLDDSRKKELKRIVFKNTRAGIYFKDGAAFKLNGIKLLKEKPVDENLSGPIVDKLNGQFNGSLSAMDISKNIAVGWNASRLASCPYYGTDDINNLVFGLQEEYISKKDESGNIIKNSYGEAEIEKKYLGTSAQGLSLESVLLPAENPDHLKAGMDYGFKSLRVNVTWFAHIIDDKYTIDPYWMARVKEVVDWAIADGYYVVLNDHHSVYKFNHDLTYGKGYNIDSNDKDESVKFLKAIWTQIATAFNGSYDEHLIFETLNEPRRTCSTDEDPNGEFWPYQLDETQRKEYVEILNDYNQIIVETIRKTDGNNAKRFIMVPSYATDVDMIFNTGFTLPEDSAEDKLMVAIHWYPMMASSPVKVFDENLKTKITNNFAKIYEEYTSKGIPFCLTEFMIPNIGSEGALFEKEERYNCLKYFCEYAGRNYISMMAWDDGMVHGVIDRTAPYKLTDGDSFFADLIAAWEKGWTEGPLPPPKTLEDIWNEGEADAMTILNEEKVLLDWGEASSICNIDAEKLTNLKENSIIKISISGNKGYKNFGFFTTTPDYTWNSIGIEGEVYSEKGYYKENNFNYDYENSPVYIRLTEKDAEAIKNGFFIAGMKVTITGIWIEF